MCYVVENIVVGFSMFFLRFYTFSCDTFCSIFVLTPLFLKTLAPRGMMTPLPRWQEHFWNIPTIPS